MFGSRAVISIFSIFLFIAAPLAVWADTAAVEDYSRANKEIRGLLDGRKNSGSYIRASGMLSDLLRVQKQVYDVEENGGKNPVADKSEELLNDASLHFSQGELDTSFKLLGEALEVVMGSLKKINGGRTAGK